MKGEIMKSKENKAIESFRSGLNCAQAVLTASAEDMAFDYDLAAGISCGFGGGMGRLQEKCGAITGSFMVMGIFNSRLYTDNNKRKEETYTMIRKLDARFKEIHGASDCRSLLNCDLKTEEGHRYAVENNLFRTICDKCISDSIRIADELMGK